VYLVEELGFRRIGREKAGKRDDGEGEKEILGNGGNDQDSVDSLRVERLRSELESIHLVCWEQLEVGVE
jgi:hypothetical protein